MGNCLPKFGTIYECLSSFIDDTEVFCSIRDTKLAAMRRMQGTDERAPSFTGEADHPRIAKESIHEYGAIYDSDLVVPPCRVKGMKHVSFHNVWFTPFVSEKATRMC